MDVILGGSIIASFLAGMVALFAPCCITVLLPAYLASAFKEKKNLVKMTFVFFAGIAVILMPIGLGAAGLAELFENFHKELYIAGGLFMIALAVMSVLGKGMAIIPMGKRMKAGLNVESNQSVFALGMFSGAATACCAPVLAGAMTLAVVSGVFWKAILLTLVYIFGMVFPLFILAYFYDKLKIAETKIIKGRLWEARLGGKTYYVHSTNLLAGIVFLAMGVILLYLALTGNFFWSPVWQANMGQALNRWSMSVFPSLNSLPEIVWSVIILGTIAWLAFRLKTKKPASCCAEEDNKETKSYEEK